ncbi:MAG: BTAD domain-containing putative transcriptional regulator [Acidimicrobiia bacterium]|nr:BTAD domain-containing putative transcriptional regulator [Acidimicrobiia bacterium]
MQVSVDGRPIEVRGERRRMLLLALAARAGRHVAVDELAEVLWGERLPADPAGSVHALVSRLRSDLGSGGSAVVTGSGYMLDTAALRVDADEFATVVAHLGDESGAGEPTRADRLRRALELWRGSAWCELPDDMVAAARAATMLSVRRSALEMLASLCADGLGDRSDLGTLERATEEFRFSEELACGLAVERIRAGRRVEALRGLSRFVARVRDETGLDPGSDVLRLEARLIAGEEPARHSAKDHGASLAAPGAADGLVGRDDDLNRLRSELDASRLVTVVGAGGVGKTALAETVAHEVAQDYPGGVYRCELAPIRSPHAIPHALSAALGLSRRSGMTPTEQAIEFLEERTALLLLDNCEHLLTEIAALIEALVTAGRSVTVLATSREPMGLRTERRFDLAPLPIAAGDGTGSSAPPAAVELFFRRARDAGVREPETWSEEASEICAALGGLPLAIELAASRCRSMTIGELADAVASDTSVLRDSRNRRPDRHRDLDTVIGWSHESLRQDARSLFSAAAVFAGGFDRQAVAWLADPQLSAAQIDDVIDELVDKSLVLVDRQGRRARFSMLEPIRQYGLRRLDEAGAARTTLDAHLSYCRHTTRAIAEHVAGPEESGGVELTKRELANLRAGHEHATDTGQVDAAMEVVAHLHDYAIWREDFELGQWAEQTLRLPGATEHHLAPVVYATAGWGRNKAGRYREAVQLAEHGLQSERHGGEATGWCHDVLAHTAYWTGDHQTAVAWANDEIQRARADRDALRVAYMLGDLAAHSAAADPTDLDAQIQRNREAVDLATAVGVPSVLAFALHALGASLRFRDENEAESVLNRSLEIAETVDCRFVLTAAAQHLAAIHCSRGTWQAAVDILEPTLQRFTRGADPAHAGMVARVLVAPLASLLHESDETDDLIVIAGYGQATPGPRIPDIDARNDALIANWRHQQGDAPVSELLDHGAATETREIIDRLSALTHTAQSPNDARDLEGQAR